MSTIAVDDPLHANPSCPCFNQHGMKIGLVLMDPTSDDFVKTLLTGAQRAADDRDLDLVVYSAASFDIGAQQAAITSMVQRGVTSLIVQIPVSLSSMAPVPILKGLAGQGIRIGSIVAGEAFTSSPDFQPAFHVGNDNYQAGVLAATKLLNAYPAFAANTVCFNPISGLSNFDLRCSGWITTMKAAGKTASQIGAYGKSESLALIQQAVDSGTVKAMFMAGAFKGPAIDAVRGTPGAIGRFLVIAFELDSVTGAELQVSDVVPFIVDTQPYLQGYTAVTLSAAYNLTETDAMATRFFRTGPVIVDQTTPNLARRVQLQSAGYPVCPSVDHPTICFNRTAAVVNNVMNAQTYNGFWSIVRSGLYEAAVDTGVQVHEWLDNSATDTKMAAYLSTLAQQEVQRRDASAQPNATSPMIGVVVAAAGSWTHAAAAIDALHAAVQVPVMGINKVLVGSQTQHSYDSYMLMSNQEAGRQAAQFAWKHGYTKMTCFHETSVVDWTSSDARCYVAESTFRALGGQASYIRVDPQNANTIAQAVAQAIQNGTQIVFSETSAALSPTIDALKASGVYGIGAGKVTAASIGDTNAYMLAELDAGRYLFGVHQSAFLQGYLPTCLFFARAVTGGYTDGNRLLPDPSATFDGTSVTYPIINAGPVIITSASSRYVNCSSALNGPST
ncbi:Periplasmic binding protein domain-containing protein [Plasmodiophora brassicae]